MQTVPVASFCLTVVVTYVGQALGQGPEAPLGTAFTYQGRLTQSGQPFNGNANLVFRLFDVPTGGTPLGTQTLPATPVTGGLFTV